MALRTVIRWVLTTVLGGVATAVGGEFFVEWAKENHAYEHPSAKVAAMMEWLTGWYAEPYFPWVAGLIGGAAATMWVEFALRRRGRPAEGATNEPAVGRPRPPPDGSPAILVTEPVVAVRFAVRIEQADGVAARLCITVDQQLTGAIITGRYAVPMHYASGGATWKWSPLIRLKVQALLLPGETIVVPYYFFPKPDVLIQRPLLALGQIVPLRWESTDAGELVRFEFVAHWQGGSARYERTSQFRYAGKRMIVDPIDVSEFDYPDDERTL